MSAAHGSHGSSPARTSGRIVLYLGILIALLVGSALAFQRAETVSVTVCVSGGEADATFMEAFMAAMVLYALGTALLLAAIVLLASEVHRYFEARPYRPKQPRHEAFRGLGVRLPIWIVITAILWHVASQIWSSPDRLVLPHMVTYAIVGVIAWVAAGAALIFGIVVFSIFAPLSRAFGSGGGGHGGGGH